MKKYVKRMLSVLLTVALLSIMMVEVALASTNTEIKSNFKYLKGNLESIISATNTSTRSSAINDLIYTYTQNGINYKVYDTISSDLSYGYGEIYKVANNGVEELVRTEKTEVVNNAVKTTIIENGKTTVNVLNLDEWNQNEQQIIPYGTYDGWPVSDTYVYWDTVKAPVEIAGLTVAAVTVTINAVIKYSSLPTPGKIVATAITSLVGKIVQESLTETYVAAEISYRYTEIPNVAIQQKAVERTIRTFYADSDYSEKLDTVTTTVYSTYYED